MKKAPDSTDDLFSDSLDFVSREARSMVLDDLHCTLHNKGYSLEGNTAESDIDWFARNIFAHVGGENAPRGHWENFPEETKERYRLWARQTLNLLPSLMMRMAHRCIWHSQAINTMLKADRAATDKAKGKRRK